MSQDTFTPDDSNALPRPWHFSLPSTADLGDDVGYEAALPGLQALLAAELPAADIRAA